MRRTPKLERLLQWQGLLCESEARAVVTSWREGCRDRWAAGEAVAHYGGPAVLLSDAIRRRRMWRRVKRLLAKARS